MKLVMQKVLKASVEVEKKIVGEINKGILIFLGIMKGDTERECDYLAKKVIEYRIFKDDNGKMNKSLIDVEGEALVVSQFTLAAEGKKGTRPSFDKAALPEDAIKLYQRFITKLKEFGVKTESGVFGAYMIVSIVNEGPVTFILEKNIK